MTLEHVPQPGTRFRRKSLNQIEQAVRHARLTGWLLGDFFCFLHWSSLPIVLIGAASVAVKFAAAGLLYAFVSALAEQKTVQLPGIADVTVDLREFFVLGVVVGLVLMAASTVLQFQVRLRAIRAARRYEEYCIRRLVALASRLPHQAADWASEVYRTEPLQSFLGRIRAAAMVVRQLTRLLPSLVSFCLGCLVLLWLNPSTTAILAAVAMAVMLAQYPLNNRAARASIKSEKHRRQATRRMAELFGLLRQAPMPVAQDAAVLNTLFKRRGLLRRDIEAFSRRADGGVLALMVSRLGTHVLLGVVLLTLGLDIIAGRQSWAAIAVYVAIVHFTLRDFLAVGKLLSSVSRHFGQVQRYMQFVRSASCAPSRTDTRVYEAQVKCLSVPSMDGAASTLALTEGQSIAVFIPPNRSCPFATMFLDALPTPADAEVGPPAWIDPSLLDPRITLAENVGLAVRANDQPIEQAVNRFAPEGAPSIRPGWLRRVPRTVAHVPPDWVLCALKVVAAGERGLTCAAIQAKLLGELSQTWIKACREILGGALFVVHTSPTSIGRFGERAVLIADTDRFVCWAPIDDKSMAAIKRLCRETLEQSRAKALAAPDEALLLED